jgi:hypothetical protein
LVNQFIHPEIPLLLDQWGILSLLFELLHLGKIICLGLPTN